MFPDDSFQTVYDRAELMLKSPYLGASLKGLRQAWFGEHAGMLIGVRYDSLAAKPIETLSRLYELLNCVSFQHNAETVSHDEPELDRAIGLPGMHRVSAPVRLTERQTVLPPDLFKHHDNSFWDVPGQNPRGVPLL
jgi:sulfotransferase